MILEHHQIKYKGKVVFEKAKMMSDFRRVPKVFVENETCFLFLTKGAFNFRTPANLLTFQEGDAMLAKCGNYFVEEIIINRSSASQEISAIGAFFYPEIVKVFFEGDFSLEPFRQDFDVLKLDVEPLLKSFIDSIDYLLENKQIADENLIATKLKELLLLLAKSKGAETIKQFVSSLFVQQEYDFKQIIQQNLYASLSLSELAHLCNSSLATFKRKFTHIYNQSPSKYITKKKLEKSRQLLFLNTPISEIAVECGFSSVSAFDKTFKKNFGISPSRYKMSQTDKSLSLL